MSPAVIFRRFWLATTVSGLGSAVTMVALPLVALIVLDASVIEVTLLTAAGHVGWLVLGLPAGVIVQRYPLRGLQVTMDLVRFAAICSIPLTWWLGVLTYTQLLVAALIVGFARVLFDVGSLTFLPAIVEKKELNARNGLITGTYAVNETGGPSVGALIIQVMGPVVALLLDAISYLVSALTLRTVPEPGISGNSHVKPVQLIKEGWTFVVRHAVMGPCLWWATATNFFGTALIALTPVYLVRAAETSAATVGFVLAMNGLGAVIGSAVATRLARRLGTARTLIVASVAGGLIALIIPFTTSLDTIYFFMIGNAGLSAGVVIGSILTRTYRQTESPPELLSRVMATTRFVSWGVMPLGAAVGGLVADSIGLHPALWLVCAGTLLAPLVLLLSPLRSRRDFG
jgi:MFS family permease